MVVGKFRRSESFPVPKPAGGRAAAAKSSFRTRCISLPSRSHPIAAHLADDLHAVRSWPPAPSSSSAAVHWLSDGLARLHLLLAGLSDVLQLPQDHDPLRCRRRRSPALADRFLDDFLRLADAHGSFRAAAIALKQHLAAAQVAIRRRDVQRLPTYLRVLRRAGKELADLAAAVREIRRRPPIDSAAGALTDAEEAEVARVMWEVAVAAADASRVVFLGVAQMSMAAASAAEAVTSRSAWAAAVLRWRERSRSKSSNKKALPEEVLTEEEEREWRRAALERLGAAEDGIASLESGCELVFKSLSYPRFSGAPIIFPSKDEPNKSSFNPFFVHLVLPEISATVCSSVNPPHAYSASEDTFLLHRRHDGKCCTRVGSLSTAAGHDINRAEEENRDQQNGEAAVSLQLLSLSLGSATLRIFLRRHHSEQRMGRENPVGGFGGWSINCTRSSAADGDIDEMAEHACGLVLHKSSDMHQHQHQHHRAVRKDAGLQLHTQTPGAADSHSDAAATAFLFLPLLCTEELQPAA
ncbi:hypothetical protein OPV22_030512 [Ensete ventricosum]|uniref:DUF641 domain-containing protein n=1 Tax=Ensete ventricosum TaxID=4639 RepID=A0AAV8QG44_ENSVE|nr:hypothetical protein OPV22_030512 [Ensete ventricosum]